MIIGEKLNFPELLVERKTLKQKRAEVKAYLHGKIDNFHAKFYNSVNNTGFYKTYVKRIKPIQNTIDELFIKLEGIPKNPKVQKILDEIKTTRSEKKRNQLCEKLLKYIPKQTIKALGLTYAVVKMGLFAVVHPFPTLAKVDHLAADLLVGLTNPQAYTEFGAGMIGGSASNAAFGNPYAVLGAALGSGLVVLGLMGSIVETGFDAEGDKGRAIALMLNEQPELIANSFEAGLLIGSICNGILGAIPSDSGSNATDGQDQAITGYVRRQLQQAAHQSANGNILTIAMNEGPGNFYDMMNQLHDKLVLKRQLQRSGGHQNLFALTTKNSLDVLIEKLNNVLTSRNTISEIEGAEFMNRIAPQVEALMRESDRGKHDQSIHLFIEELDKLSNRPAQPEETSLRLSPNSESDESATGVF